MMTEMKLPACYAVIDENEMTYLDGGATIADSDAYKAFLNVGQVFNPLTSWPASSPVQAPLSTTSM